MNKLTQFIATPFSAIFIIAFLFGIKFMLSNDSHGWNAAIGLGLVSTAVIALIANAIIHFVVKSQKFRIITQLIILVICVLLYHQYL